MANTLTIPQSLVLLALRDEDGRFMGSWHKIVFAGAILSELYLRGALGLSGRKQTQVKVLNTEATGSPALDDALNLIACSPKQKSLKGWITTMSNRSHSQKLLLEELIALGALSQEKQKVLLFFKITRWPEANGYYETQLKNEMQRIMFSEDAVVTDRMAAIINLANQSNLLKRNFDRDQLAAHKARIKAITDESCLACPATDAAIKAAQAAVLAATMAASTATTTMSVVT